MSFSRLAVFQDGSDEVTPFTEKNHGPAFDFGARARILFRRRSCESAWSGATFGSPRIPSWRAASR